MIPNAQVFWSRKVACYKRMDMIEIWLDSCLFPQRKRVAYGNAAMALLKAADRWHKAYLCALRLDRND
jgi:hypothetical protein